jgi:LCP family protein required for cell wall assembly
MGYKLYGNTSKKIREAFYEDEDLDKNKKNSGGKGKVIKRFLIFLAIVLIAGTAAWIVLHNTVVIAPQIKNDGSQISVNAGTRKSEYFTFVLCGTDDSGVRTDTIMVASYDISKKKISIISVPRDTMLNVNWSVKKINSAFAFDGIEGLKRELKGILGFGVDFYAVVNLSAFKEIVDAIGGVRFNVPEDMYYEDPDQDLLIDLKAGEQLLDGEKAMELIRYRSYAMADIKRISVQQAFIKAVFAQTLNVSNITKVNDLAGIFTKYMKTDLTTGNIIWLGTRMMGVKAEDVFTLTLPGRNGSYNGGSYWQLDAEKVLETVNKYLVPAKKELLISDLDIVNISNGYLVSTTGKKVKDTSGGGTIVSTPAPTPSPGTSPTPTPKPSVTPTPSGTPGPSASPTASPKPSVSPVPSATPQVSAKPTPSAKP